jgi:predicted acylesterase/phospholipase RssA
MGGEDRMWEVWHGIRNKDVYRHKFGAARAAWAAVRGEPMLDTRPLSRMIDRELSWRGLGAGFTTGFVDLETGLLNRKTYVPGQPKEALCGDVYASAAIPFVFPLYHNEADGGLIEPVPLDPAIKDASTEDVLVIISCHPIGAIQQEPQDGSPFSTLSRTLEIMQHTLTQKSVEPFLLINRLASKGELVDEATGRVYRKFKSVIIAPKEPLPWGMVDFSGSGRGLEMGIRAAQDAMDNLSYLLA